MHIDVKFNLRYQFVRRNALKALLVDMYIPHSVVSVASLLRRHHASRVEREYIVQICYSTENLVPPSERSVEEF